MTRVKATRVVIARDAVGGTRYDGKSIRESLECSLRRLAWRLTLDAYSMRNPVHAMVREPLA
jgi:hypothetical protein